MRQVGVTEYFAAFGCLALGLLHWWASRAVRHAGLTSLGRQLVRLDLWLMWLLCVGAAIAWVVPDDGRMWETARVAPLMFAILSFGVAGALMRKKQSTPE